MALKDRLETYRQVIQHPANRHRKMQAALDYLRWNFGKRILEAEYILPLIEHARIIVSERQNYATLTYVNGLWDFPEMMFLLHFLRPGDLFADIGANVGGYTILASAVAGAKSLSFEPVPVTYTELIRNLRLNEISDLVEPHRCGLGSEAASMRMTATLGGMNHIVTEQTRGETVDIEVVRFDDVLAGRSCNLVKMDAEGYEREIIIGAGRALADPSLHGIIAEFNGSGLRYGHSDERVHAAISEFGFKPARYDPERRALNVLEGFDPARMNTLYVRPSDYLLDRLRSGRPIRYKGRQL